jgi:hypothetical protein
VAYDDSSQAVTRVLYSFVFLGLPAFQEPAGSTFSSQAVYPFCLRKNLYHIAPLVSTWLFGTGDVPIVSRKTMPPLRLLAYYCGQREEPSFPMYSHPSPHYHAILLLLSAVQYSLPPPKLISSSPTSSVCSIPGAPVDSLITLHSTTAAALGVVCIDRHSATVSLLSSR